MITKENIWKEAWKNNLKVSLEILKSDLVDKVKDRNGETPLHELAYKGIREVLDHPSVDKVQNNKGGTPLHELAFCGYLTKEDLRKKYPWYKKEIKNIYKAIDEIVNTPTSVRFILED